MFAESLRITGLAVTQILILGAIGYFLVRRNILGQEGLNSLSRLAIEVTLPVLVFCQLIQEFRFNLYPDWWLFPLLSILVTVIGLAIGGLFTFFINGTQHRLQFLSLVTFQNSGYLPLGLIATLLPKEKAAPMLVYLFLFLLGFNLVMWSAGVYLLTFSRAKKFELGSFFSPPVIAIIFSLLLVFFGLQRFFGESLLKPLKMVGDCTLPLAMLVVGGNLAQIRLKEVDKKAIFLMIIAKLAILPLLGLLLIRQFKFPEMLGLLLLIELAMPPATSLSLITSHYKKEDLLISQGVFYGHLFSIATIPLFLSLYFTLVMIK
ncbi:MAG: AEC family transporter [Candidatus Omnitrophota bacterium]|jgi:hypothetical protein